MQRLEIKGSIKLANNELESLAEVGDITFANPDIDQSDAFISGRREYPQAIHFSRPIFNDSEA